MAQYNIINTHTAQLSYRCDYQYSMLLPLCPVVIVTDSVMKVLHQMQVSQDVT